MHKKINLDQQFSASVPQTLLNYPIPDYLVRGTDFFFLRLSNKKTTTPNTRIAIQCE